jgi:hypothetical protein
MDESSLLALRLCDPTNHSRYIYISPYISLLYTLGNFSPFRVDLQVISLSYDASYNHKNEWCLRSTTRYFKGYPKVDVLRGWHDWEACANSSNLWVSGIPRSMYSEGGMK